MRALRFTVLLIFAVSVFAVTFSVQAQMVDGPPMLHLPKDLAVQATSADGAVVTYEAYATGGMDENYWIGAFGCTPESGALFPIGKTHVQCSATNNASQTTTGSFNVTVTAPQQGDVVAEATSASGAVVRFDAGACTPASGSLFPLGATAVHCASGASFHVTVVDTTPPTLGLPANIVSDHPTVKFDTRAYDYVDYKVDVVCTPPSNTLFALGTTTVNCSATDSHANTATGSFTVTILHGTRNDITAEATSRAGAVVEYEGSCTPASGSTFGFGYTIVQCSDGGSFKVTVVDRTPPMLTLPADIYTTDPVVTFNATAMDTVDGNVAVTCTPASGSTFHIGTTTVQCVARDRYANMSMAAFHVTVIASTRDDITAEAESSLGAVVMFEGDCTPPSGSIFPIGSTLVQCSEGTSFHVHVADTTAPTLTLPDDIVTNDPVVTFNASASDSVDGNVDVSCTPASGSTFPSGTTTVQCTARDDFANSTTGSFHVTVVSAAREDITAEATSAAGASVTFTGDCTPASGSTFALGTTHVQCSDGASFHVHVVDTTAPTLVLPGAITSSDPVVTFTASASDSVDGNVNVSCTPASGSTFAYGTTTVQCTATDAHANTATGAFAVNVIDETAPVIASITVSPEQLWPANHKLIPVTVTVTASDDVDDAPQSRIVMITGNEPVRAPGSGNTEVDWQITGPLTADLRAERSGDSRDRIYTLVIECRDAAGNRTFGTVPVVVPHAEPASNNAPVTASPRRRATRH